MMQMHGGNLREIAKRYGLSEEGIIDFSSNCNPLGFPEGIRALLRREADAILRYPDACSAELVTALAERWGLAAKNIMVGNGSTELIYLIPRALKPRRALIIQPAFGEYERSLSSMRCRVSYIDLKEKRNFRLEREEVIPRLSGVDILYLCNPGNPTGALMERAAIDPLLRAAEGEGVVTVVDEAFMDFSENHSLARQVKARKGLIVLRSMTKFFAIPGLRLGYLLAHPSIVSAINLHKEPWSVNALAQKAGIACLDDEPFRLRTARFMVKERHHLFNRLSAIRGIEPYPSQTSFILAKITRKGLTSGDLYRALAKRGILIRDCRSFRGLGSSFIRLAVNKRELNDLLIRELRKIVER